VPGKSNVSLPGPFSISGRGLAALFEGGRPGAERTNLASNGPFRNSRKPKGVTLSCYVLLQRQSAQSAPASFVQESNRLEARAKLGDLGVAMNRRP